LIGPDEDSPGKPLRAIVARWSAVIRGVVVIAMGQDGAAPMLMLTCASVVVAMAVRAIAGSLKRRKLHFRHGRLDTNHCIALAIVRQRYLAVIAGEMRFFTLRHIRPSAQSGNLRN
jgi:hypothetical protein